MLRTLAEKLTSGLSYTRRLPRDLGHNRIRVSPSAGLAYLVRPLAAIDPVLLGLAREFVRPGQVVWDVGANVGLFTFACAHRCGPGGLVVALEPDDSLVRLLGCSSAMQTSSSAPVRIIQAALAQSVDLRTFCIATRSRSANFLEGYGSTQAGGAREAKTIVTVSLDWLAERLPAPDVIKIDAEGAEAEILNGATRLFETRRPVVLCEVSSAASPAVTEFFRTRSYRLHDGQVRGRRHELSAAPWNTIAVPSEARQGA